MMTVFASKIQKLLIDSSDLRKSY